MQFFLQREWGNLWSLWPSIGTMMLKLFLLLSLLYVGCFAYLAPGIRIRTHYSIMSPSSCLFARSCNTQLSAAAISNKDECCRPSAKQIITNSLVSLPSSEIFWTWLITHSVNISGCFSWIRRYALIWSHLFDPVLRQSAPPFFLQLFSQISVILCSTSCCRLTCAGLSMSTADSLLYGWKTLVEGHEFFCWAYLWALW